MSPIPEIKQCLDYFKEELEKIEIEQAAPKIEPEIPCCEEKCDG